MSDYKYAIYHAGMKEWWVLDDDSFIIHLTDLPKWSKGFVFEDEIDLRSYTWRELKPHSVPMKSYINNEKMTHMTVREWELWVENEPQHVTYIDELLCVLEETTFDVSHGIEDWLENLKGIKYENI